MLSPVCSAAVNGIEAYEVEVEVNCGYEVLSGPTITPSELNVFPVTGKFVESHP
jgi:hypothetical protein